MRATTVMLIEDDAALRDALCGALREAGYTPIAMADGPSALTALEGQEVDLLLSDLCLGAMDGDEVLRRVRRLRPELPVMLMTGDRDIERAAAAIRAGAADLLAKPFSPADLCARIERCLGPAHTAVAAPPQTLVAEDPLTRRVLAVAERVAASDATVMITGASGTGKEVLARFLHDASRRARAPFLAINCAAIPEQMLEAELFGYERGAFTGAHRAHPGKFEQAQGGTLLLDEITEMDLSLQSKLLRVLQEREVQRIGSRETLDLDVRVLATSNRDLRAAVDAGRFREDLYYRLNVFPLRLPTLAERPEDVLPLARRLLARHLPSGRTAPELSAAAAAALRAWPWPGNVRELENLMQRALILCVGDRIEAQDLVFGEPSDGQRTQGAPRPAPTQTRAAVVDETGLGEEMRCREHDVIRDALCASQGSRKDAAQRLGLPARTLRYKIARLREAGLDPIAAADAALAASARGRRMQGAHA